MSDRRNHASRASSVSFWSVCRAVAEVTFREVIRDKILYNILLVAAVVFSAGFLASRLTYGDPVRVILDFGVSGVNLSSALIGIFLGASALIREFERRTILVALSHPISRLNFLVGKYLGVAAVLLANWLLISLALCGVLASSGGIGAHAFSGAFFCALFFDFLQSLILAGIAMLFSTFSTVSLSVIFGLGFYLIGNSVGQLRQLANHLESPVSSWTLKVVALLIPNLENFSLGFNVTYGLPVGAGVFFTSVFYTLVLISFTLLLSGFLLQSREI